MSFRHLKTEERRYRELGRDLFVRTGAPESVAPELARLYDADAIFYSGHDRVARRNRQRSVGDVLAGAYVAELDGCRRER